MPSNSGFAPGCSGCREPDERTTFDSIAWSGAPSIRPTIAAGSPGGISRQAARKDWIISEYVVGTAGLMERLGLGVRLILGFKRPGGYVVRWDQLDLSDPDRPRLTCSVEDLRRE